ncbi:Fc.00g011600.m01.CDS01 [Cosmosporella sp. VM-42]
MAEAPPTPEPKLSLSDNGHRGALLPGLAQAAAHEAAAIGGTNTINGSLTIVEPEPLLLKIPYTVREQIYFNLLLWLKIELYLYINSSCSQPKGDDPEERNDARVCVVRRTGPGKGYLSKDGCHDFPVPCHRGFPIQISTFLNLLESCKQIRAEISELFWRRTEFTIAVNYNLLSSSIGPEMILASLSNSFAGAIISKSVQKLTVEFCATLPNYVYKNLLHFSPSNSTDPQNLPEDFNEQRKAIYQILIARAKICIGDVLSNLPNLTRIKLLIPEYGDDSILDATLSSLKQIKSLRTVLFQDHVGDEVLELWKREIQAEFRRSPSEFSDFESISYTGMVTHKSHIPPALWQTQDAILTAMGVTGNKSDRNELFSYVGALDDVADLKYKKVLYGDYAYPMTAWDHRWKIYKEQVRRERIAWEIFEKESANHVFSDIFYRSRDGETHDYKEERSEMVRRGSRLRGSRRLRRHQNS